MRITPTKFFPPSGSFRLWRKGQKLLGEERKIKKNQASSFINYLLKVNTALIDRYRLMIWFVIKWARTLSFKSAKPTQMSLTPKVACWFILVEKAKGWDGDGGYSLLSHSFHLLALISSSVKVPYLPHSHDWNLYHLHYCSCRNLLNNLYSAEHPPLYH